MRDMLEIVKIIEDYKLELEKFIPPLNTWKGNNNPFFERIKTCNEILLRISQPAKGNKPK